MPTLVHACLDSGEIEFPLPNCCGGSDLWPTCWNDTVKLLQAVTGWDWLPHVPICIDRADPETNPNYGQLAIEIPEPCGCACWNYATGNPCVTTFKISWDELTILDKTRAAGSVNAVYQGDDSCEWRSAADPGETGAILIRQGPPYVWAVYIEVWLDAETVFKTAAFVDPFDCQTGGTWEGLSWVEINETYYGSSEEDDGGVEP